MAHKILFYSYKGGTGRSCALANIATEIAIQGKKVLLVDLDIEGPSLKVVFDIKSESIPDDMYIQDYLRASEDEEWPYSQALIDLKKEFQQKGEDTREFLGELWYLPASESYEKTVHFHGDTVQRKIDRLLKKIERDHSIDLVLIDSPNGYGSMTQQAFFVSDLIVLLFKWSKQHIMGSSKISEIMRYLDIDYLPVASLVPNNLPPFVRNHYESEMEKRLKKKTLLSIPENDSFKWSESCVMQKREKFIEESITDIEKADNMALVKSYEALAKQLMSMM